MATRALHPPRSSGIGSGDVPDHAAALDRVLAELSAGGRSFNAVSHRVVHGGARFSTPQLVDRALLDELRRLDPDRSQPSAAGALADRSHQPALSRSAAGRLLRYRLPPHDAACRADVRPAAAIWDAGVRRYGFHGLSYEYILQALRALDPGAADGRVIVAHLGNGASMAAMREGRSVETTMGFSPAGGLVMGTRLGDLDPSVLLYLLQHSGSMRPTR